jgi:hypothetical protein
LTTISLPPRDLGDGGRKKLEEAMEERSLDIIEIHCKKTGNLSYVSFSKCTAQEISFYLILYVFP